MSRKGPRQKQKEGLEPPSQTVPSPFESDPISAIDESPEFYDPYSDLNLFLSQKIKKEMRHCSNSKAWSSQIQDELLHKIAPEFQELFPKYRLGVTALKKAWEKVQYFSKQIQEQKEALTQDGKLNLPFFIKENLKSTGKLFYACHVHPCHYAHQLAFKMGECIAVVDGIRPKLDQLTRTIWSLQRHLIPKLAPEHFTSPYDENEKTDKLIVKFILEITAQHPGISQAELSFYVHKRLCSLRALTIQYAADDIRKMLGALHADHCHVTTQRMEKVLETIPYPTAKCLKSEMAVITIDSPHFGPQRVVEEALSFFVKATRALSDVKEEEIERKIQNWAIQGDMLIRWIRLNHCSALFIELEKLWHPKKDFETMIERTLQALMERYPHLFPFAQDVKLQAWIYLKYLFYTRHCDEEMSTYDRFLCWNQRLLSRQNLSDDELIDHIERMCKKMLPLVPFNKAHAQAVLMAQK